MTTDVREALARLIEVYDAMGAPRGPARIMAEAALAASPQVEPERSLMASRLEAMAENYSDGHCWDHLDGETCRKAAQLLRAQAEPEGWQLVPKEPTPEMVDATYHGQPIADIYRDMLSAAPKRPE